MVVENLELCQNKIKHRELLNSSDEIIKLYRSGFSLRDIAYKFDTNHRAIGLVLKKNSIDIIPSNKRQKEFTCITCNNNFLSRSSLSKYCSACRVLEDRRWAREKYRKVIAKNQLHRTCIKCGDDISQYKLDRKFCNLCRQRDCSYLKYMQLLLKSYNYQCTYCGIKISRQVPPTIDHKIPISRGGSNDISNLTIACKICNCRKGIKTDLEFKED